MRGQGNSRARVAYGASREATTKALGQPTKKVRLVDEIEGGCFNVVYYQTNKLHFKKNRLEGFELHNDFLAYGQSPETAFCIGSKVSHAAKNLQPGAPIGASYRISGKPLSEFEVDAKGGKSRNVLYRLAAVSYSKHNGVYIDATALELLFDANDWLILIAL